MKSQPNQSKVYFEHLDVVRFFAAFMVVIFHSHEAWKYWYSSGNANSLSVALLNQLLANLRFGVDIFFLISGFLITYILLEEKKRFGNISIGKFMVRRTLRIWPLYYLLIGLSPLLVHWVNSETPNYLANALFIGNFDTIKSQSWIYPFTHFWSICIEEHFYLVWPFIIAFIPKKRLLPLFSILILGSIVFRIYAVTQGEGNWYVIYLHTISRFDVLIIGAIAAYFYSEKPFTIKLPPYIRYILYFILIGTFTVEYVASYFSIFQAGFKKYFFISIISVLLLDYNFNPKLGHFLKPGSIIHYFGRISYGIYMYSTVLINIVILKIMHPLGIENIAIYYMLIITLSILIPIFSYELFEKRFLVIAKRFRKVETKR